MKMSAPVICEPIPMPAHPPLVVALIWKKVSLPEDGRFRAPHIWFEEAQKVEVGAAADEVVVVAAKVSVAVITSFD